MDYDGSLLNTGGKTIIGSANDQEYGAGNNPSLRIKGWWNVHPDSNTNCQLHSQYTLYSCPQGSQEIGSLQFDVNQLTNNVNGWPQNWDARSGHAEKRVGIVSQFGYYGNDRRSTIMTNNPGVTGVTGDRGWYTYFHAGTPQEIFIRTTQVPRVNGARKHIIVAFKYPSGVSFDITTENTKFNQHTNINQRRVNKAFSFSEMYNDPEGMKYYVKPSPGGQVWLFLKIVNLHSAADGYFERNGIRLYDVDNHYFYRVASCYSENNCPRHWGTVPVYSWTTDEIPPRVSQML
jgi:hypothetical protein